MMSILKQSIVIIVGSFVAGFVYGYLSTPGAVPPVFIVDLPTVEQHRERVDFLSL